jgi:hypothetical protein
VVDTTTSSGTVTVKCSGSTCPAGVYRIDLYGEVKNANTTQTSPNFSFNIGWTDETGAKTVTAVQADGSTTVSTGTTDNVYSATMNVKTTGALSIAMVLSGSTGAQKITWEYAATRLR